MCVCVFIPSVVFYSLWPHGLQPARLFCPWDSPGKNTAVGFHFLLHHIINTILSYMEIICKQEIILKHSFIKVFDFSAVRFLFIQLWKWEHRFISSLPYCKGKTMNKNTFSSLTHYSEFTLQMCQRYHITNGHIVWALHTSL